MLIGTPLFAQMPEDQASDSPLFQEQTTDYAEIGVYARYFQAYGSLLANGYQPGMGVNMEIFSRNLFADMPINVQFGGNMSYDFAGSESFDIMVDEPYTSAADLTIGNHQVGLHGAIRLITPDRFPLQAYVQGLIGTRFLFSQESLELTDYHPEDESCPEIETFYPARQAALSYGVEGGFRIRLNPNTWLDFRGSYLTGTGASFVDLATAQAAEANIITYDMTSAPRSENWGVGVGLTFHLREMASCRVASATCLGVGLFGW